MKSTGTFLRRRNGPGKQRLVGDAFPAKHLLKRVFLRFWGVINDYVKFGAVGEEAKSPSLWDKRRDKRASVNFSQDWCPGALRMVLSEEITVAVWQQETGAQNLPFVWGLSPLDPVPGEPKGAAGVETRRSRKRSRAAPHLPQVSLCGLRNGRVSLRAHLLFLYLGWRLN